MEYYEITLNTPSEDIDKKCDELSEIGISGFVIENEEDFYQFLQNNKRYWDYVDEELEKSYSGLSRIKFWIEKDNIDLLNNVKSRYEDISIRNVQDSDWENNWRDYYKPIKIGKKLVVVPEWEENPCPDRIPLILDPGLIFGTGSHPTTKMCLEAIEDYAHPGKKVLDLGCGSGILGIGTLVLGCDKCVGVDIDPKAPDIVLSNASLNVCTSDKISALSGDILTDKSLVNSLGGEYDIVLANIVSDVIIPLSKNVRQFMAQDAVFICSGIIDGRETEVENSLRKNGFEIIKHMHDDEWNAYICK